MLWKYLAFFAVATICFTSILVKTAVLSITHFEDKLLETINYSLKNALNCLEVIPERANIESENPKYVKDLKVYVRRFGRNSPYSLNIELTILQTLGNNASLHLAFFELLNNEYKESFIDMNMRLCDLIKTDKFFSPLLKRIGLPCPLPPDHYKLLNLTLLSVPAVENFPYQWPFEKGKVLASLRTYPGKLLMASASVMLRFKQKKKGSR